MGKWGFSQWNGMGIKGLQWWQDWIWEHRRWKRNPVLQSEAQSRESMMLLRKMYRRSYIA